MIDDLGGRKRKIHVSALEGPESLNSGMNNKRRRKATIRSPESVRRHKSLSTKSPHLAAAVKSSLDIISNSPLPRNTPSTIATTFGVGDEDFRKVKFPSFPRKIGAQVFVDNDSSKDVTSKTEQDTVSAVFADVLVDAYQLLANSPTSSAITDDLGKTPLTQSRLSLDPSNALCYTPEPETNSRVCVSPRTPNAPRRTKSMKWLRLMMNNAADELKNLLQQDTDVDLNSDIFIEWITWEAKGPSLTQSEIVWLPPLCLACRWTSPKTIQTLIDCGADVLTVNHHRQNLLGILCSQPILTIRVIRALRDFYKPEMYSITRAQLFSNKSSIAVAEFIKLRKKEMILVARLLLLYGVSPEEKDIFGKSANDYCYDFGHKSIIRLFNLARKNRRVYMALEKRSCSHLEDAHGVVSNESSIEDDDKEFFADSDSTLIECSTPQHCRTPSKEYRVEDVFTTPMLESINCPSSLPTGCPSTTMNVKRRGRRLLGKVTCSKWKTQTILDV